MLTTQLSSSVRPMTMGGGVDLDLTAAVAGALFLLLLVVLNVVLFRPYLAIVAKREAMTDGASEAASGAQAQAASLRAEYAAGMESARAEAAALREGLRAEAKKEEESLLAAAREQAAATAVASRERIAAELAAGQAQVEAQARLLAAAIVSKTAPSA